MKGFHNLVLVGVLLVTLLVIIDTIDARKKEKKREIGNREYEEKNDSKEKHNKLKNPQTSKKAQPRSFKEGDYNVKYGEESLPYKTKKETKKTKRETKTSENGPKTKTTKSYKRVKKYKVVEDGIDDVLNRRATSIDSTDTTTSSTTSPPPSSTDSSGTRDTTTRTSTTYPPPPKRTPTYPPPPKRTPLENQILDEVRRSIQASFPKYNFTAEYITNFGSPPPKDDKLNRMFDGEYIEREENTDTGPKRRKYKLVEVILEENQDEGRERNETLEEMDVEQEEEEEENSQSHVERIESEEVIEKLKTTKTTKGPKVKRLVYKIPFVEQDETADEDIEETDVTEEPSNYSAPDSRPTVCKRFPVDPNRQEPTKVTFYVVEKIVDGKIVREVLPKEDGVSMCEVAELLSDKYLSNDPDNNE